MDRAAWRTRGCYWLVRELAALEDFHVELVGRVVGLAVVVVLDGLSCDFDLAGRGRSVSVSMSSSLQGARSEKERARERGGETTYARGGDGELGAPAVGGEHTPACVLARVPDVCARVERAEERVCVDCRVRAGVSVCARGDGTERTLRLDREEAEEDEAAFLECELRMREVVRLHAWVVENGSTYEQYAGQRGRTGGARCLVVSSEW